MEQEEMLPIEFKQIFQPSGKHTVALDFEWSGFSAIPPALPKKTWQHLVLEAIYLHIPSRVLKS